MFLYDSFFFKINNIFRLICQKNTCVVTAVKLQRSDVSSSISGIFEQNAFLM